MASSLTELTSRMSPGQLREYRNAQNAPVGTLQDAALELNQLEARGSQIRAGLTKAATSYADETSLPESVPADAARTVREQAEAASRRDLEILTARARSIANQLGEVSSEPSLANVPDDVLDGANRFAPLIASQVQGASLPAISRQLKAAVVRDDPSELLALATVLSPILAAKQASPDNAEDTYALFDFRDALRQISSRRRDHRLDLAQERARQVADTLTDLDYSIVSANQARTGETDPYQFLAGLMS